MNQQYTRHKDKTHARPVTLSLARHVACHTLAAEPIPFGGMAGGGGGGAVGLPGAARAGGGGGRCMDLPACIVEPLPAAANAPQRASAANGPSSCDCCCCCTAG